jgi:putative CocE/NonD family hydrolase
MGSQAGRGWNSALDWPPPEVRSVSMYFQNYAANCIDSVNDGALDLEPPAGTQAWDEYTVDYSTTSGTATRWESGFGGRFGYGDLASNDRKGLTYTSAELPQDLEFTGHPVAHLWISTEAADVDLFVYLEDVGPDGFSRYVTEGALRASHRALSQPPYELSGLPYHRSFAEDMQPLTGEPVELVFELLPTSHIFAAGHRLRFTLTGADADNALTPRLDPPPSIRVYTEAGRASYVAMPLVVGK